MIRVYINGRLQDINDITITKKLPEIGSLEPSRVSAVINNTGEYKTDPNTNQIVNSYGEVINKNTEIYIEKDVDGVTKRVFTGWIDRPQLNIEKKTLQIQAHDWATILQKNKLDNRFYVNASFDTIIKDILPASMDKTGIYTITDIIDYVFFEDMTVGEAIEKLIKSVGGRFYFDEYNKPVFDGGYKYAEAQTTQEFTETINDVRISSISKIEHSLQDENVDRVTVTSETYKQQTKEDYIYIAENIACETNPYPTGDDQFVAKFDDPVYYVQPLSEVEIQTNDGITLDFTFWNSQFITGTSTPKNPKEMLLKFNGGGTGQTVELLKIKGKFLRKETFVNSEGDQSEKANEKEYKPELVQSATWCNKLSQYLYREWHNRPTIQLTLSELQKAKEYKVGKKINLFMDAEDIQNRMVIHEIVERYSLNTAKIKLKLKYDAGNSFTPDAKPEIIKRPSNQPNIPDIETLVMLNQTTINNIFADNIITPDEKKILRVKYNEIQDEYQKIIDIANTYAVSTTDYTTQYNNLINYLDTLSLFVNTTTLNVDRAVFEANFNSYFVSREYILNVIQLVVNDRISTTELELSNISADNKLTPAEKKSVKVLYNQITSEYDEIKSSAETYALNSTVNYNNFVSSYTTLKNYLDGLNLSTTDTETIDRTTFNNNFNSYFVNKNRLIDDINKTAENRIGLTETELSNISADNKLTPAEKKTVRTEWQRIQNEYASITNQANAYDLTYLDYTTQYNALSTYITSLNLTTTTTETIDRAVFIDKFENYYIEKDVIVGKIQNRIHDEGTKDFVGVTDPSTLYTLANGVIWHDTGANELKQWNATTSSWTILRTNYDIGKIKVEGDNLYAGEIKSNALLSDGTTPVSKINLDDGTFKFGDDVSANKQFIAYDGSNLIIAGGNIVRVQTNNINLTVGSGGDFATLNEALDFLSSIQVKYFADNTEIQADITLKSGYVFNNEFLRFYNVNLSWVTIFSEDDVINVDFSIAPPLENYFVYAINSKLPNFSGLTFKNISGNILSLILLENSSLRHVGGGNYPSGVGNENFANGYILRKNSYLEFSDLWDKSNNSISSQSSKIISLGEVQCEGNCTVRYGGFIVEAAGYITTDGGTTPVNYNIPRNTLTSDGIIFG